MKWPKADAPTYYLGLQRPPVNMADALRMEGKQKTEETKQDVPDDQRKQSKNLYEDAEWSDLSMKDLVAVQTTAKAFIRALDAARQRLRAARARSEPEFVDAGESVDEADEDASWSEADEDAEESVDEADEDAEWSELSMKDIRAIETTARAFVRELDTAFYRLRIARARSEPAFEAERRVRARRLVQVLTSCPPTPETAESPLSLSPTPSPRAYRLLDIHETVMEAAEARAQQEDDADDVKPHKNRLKKKPRKKRLKKKPRKKRLKKKLRRCVRQFARS